MYLYNAHGLTSFEFRSSDQKSEVQNFFCTLGMDDGMSGFCIKSRVGGSSGGGTKCGRWNPTSEQVKVLTALFRSGFQTPSTEQIQKISSQLSFYGMIESKNVFYWFQNHKARERQKRRRVSSVAHEQHDQVHREDKVSCANRKL